MEAVVGVEIVVLVDHDVGRAVTVEAGEGGGGGRGRRVRRGGKT